MIETSGILFLESGRWRWRVDEIPGTGEEVLELVEPGNSNNKMQAPLPFSWRQLSFDAFRDLARRPQVRLWLDELAILWRVAAIGRGTPFPYPFEKRHMVFDSQQSWAGIVEFPPPVELGDLTHEELREYRDRCADIGGRRNRFRMPG